MGTAFATAKVVSKTPQCEWFMCIYVYVHLYIHFSQYPMVRTCVDEIMVGTALATAKVVIQDAAVVSVNPLPRRRWG